MNIVILSGHLLTTPVGRDHPSGGTSWSFDLGTELVEATAAAVALPERVSVPVVWVSDAAVPTWDAATELVVAGVVRRRFFRSGGATQSRTEVVAATVVEVTKRRPLAKAVERAAASLGADERATLRSVVG